MTSSIALSRAIGHVAGVLAHPHEGEAQDDLALAVGGHPAAADRVADADLGHVPDADRHAVVRPR